MGSMLKVNQETNSRSLAYRLLVLLAILLILFGPRNASTEGERGAETAVVEIEFKDDKPMHHSGACRVSSFCYDEGSGAFFVADSFGGCIVKIAADGSRTDISLPALMSIGSIEYSDGALYILDNMQDLSDPAKLHIMSLAGDVLATHEILLFEDMPPSTTGENTYRKLTTIYAAEAGLIISDGTEYLLQAGDFSHYGRVEIQQEELNSVQPRPVVLSYAGTYYQVEACFELMQPLALKTLSDNRVCFSYWDVKGFGMYRKVAAIASPSGELAVHYLPLGASFITDPIRFDSQGQLYVASLEGRKLTISQVHQFSTAERETLILQTEGYWGENIGDPIDTAGSLEEGLQQSTTTPVSTVGQEVIIQDDLESKNEAYRYFHVVLVLTAVIMLVGQRIRR